jgi:predicted amidophosphoribosyltransferase
MWPMYFCPGCRAQVAYGDRFCGNCGINLICVIQQIPPLSYNHQYTDQQWQQYRQSPHNQTPASGNLNQYQQQYVYANGGTVTPISTEIYKLLADIFDKRIKHNKM